MDTSDALNMGKIAGPFYSWIRDQPSPEQIIDAVNDVVATAKRHGSELLIGFSQGAAIALLAASKLSLPVLAICPVGSAIFDACGHDEAIPVPATTCFLIGLEDGFKNDSERLLQRLASNPTALYVKAGHEVSVMRLLTLPRIDMQSNILKLTESPDARCHGACVATSGSRPT